MKEPSRPLELLVLEPEKDRFTLSSLEFNFPFELKRGFFFVGKIQESGFHSRVVRKKIIIWEEAIFLLNVLIHIYFDYFLIFYHILFIFSRPSRSSFSGQLRLTGGFLPTYFFYDLIGNHIKTIPI